MKNLSSISWTWEPEFVVSAWSKLNVLWGRCLTVTEHIMSTRWIGDRGQIAWPALSPSVTAMDPPPPPQCVDYWRIPLLSPSHDCGICHGKNPLAAVTVVDVSVFKACSTGSRVTTWRLWFDTFHRLTVRCMSKTRRFRQILCNILCVFL